MDFLNLQIHVLSNTPFDNLTQNCEPAELLPTLHYSPDIHLSVHSQYIQSILDATARTTTPSPEALRGSGMDWSRLFQNL